MSANAWRRSDRPLVIAHRGHSVERPENTLTAYRRAIELGADMIECDVNVTRDGDLVMIHDWTLDRTTNGRGPVAALTLDEIRGLDAGSSFGAEWAGERVPTTIEAIELAREAGILMCFEVKGGDPATFARTAEALADLLAARDALGWAFMSSYDHVALALARRRVPELMLAPERLPDDVPAEPADAVGQARALGAPVLQNHWRFLAPELVDAVHAADVALWAWPTTAEDEIRVALDAGVDAVMGDDVEAMTRLVAGRTGVAG